MLKASLWLCALLVAACAADDSPPGDEAAPVTRDAAPGAPSGGSSTSDGSTSPTTPAEPPKPVPGLRAEYFAGYHDLELARVEPNLDHAWGETAPGEGVGKDRFSARWTGTLAPKIAGKTTIGIDGDDGVRVWIDGKLVIDDWRAHFEERHSAIVDLDPAKPVSIRVDYFEADLDAQIRLWWSAGGLAEEPIPAEQLTTVDVATGLPGPKPPIANPVFPTSCPDPGVVANGGLFYMVCTGGKFGIKQSRDLVTWTSAGASILPDGKPTWAANGGRNWAPEIHEIGNDFLAYYTTVNDANVLSIGVAKAPKPTGPYVDSGKPLVENGLGVIDATQFTDDDGSRWLVYKIDGNSQGKPTPILVRKLAADGLSFAAGSSPKQILVNDAGTWEGGVVEAPWVVKHAGKYFMFYSGNVYDERYRTGVARATTLTGAWEKKGAPVLANNDAWVGPGHGSVVQVPGTDGETQDYFVYHAWRNQGGGVANKDLGRLVLVDRIEWGANGWPTIGGGTPTTGTQPWPGEPF
ncbi:MAG: family 43 glycosylhydrolase [Labilithrix sp.]